MNSVTLNQKVLYSNNRFMNFVEEALFYGGREVSVSNQIIEISADAVQINPWACAAKVIGTIVFPVFVLIAFCIREASRTCIHVRIEKIRLLNLKRRKALEYTCRMLYKDSKYLLCRDFSQKHMQIASNLMLRPDGFIKDNFIGKSVTSSTVLPRLELFKVQLEDIKNRLPHWCTVFSEALKRMNITSSRENPYGYDRYSEGTELAGEFFRTKMETLEWSIKRVECNINRAILLDETSSLEKRNLAYDFFLTIDDIAAQEEATALLRPYLPEATKTDNKEKIDTFFIELNTPPTVAATYDEASNQNDVDLPFAEDIG
jgi:hypothetical protein